MIRFISLKSIAIFIAGGITTVSALYAAAYIDHQLTLKKLRDARAAEERSATSDFIRNPMATRFPLLVPSRAQNPCTEARQKANYYLACIEASLIKPGGGCDLYQPGRYIVEPDNLAHAKQLLESARAREELHCSIRVKAE